MKTTKRTFLVLKGAQAAKRDAVLADFLFNHKGRENAVSSGEIAEYLTAQGYPTKANRSHSLVRHIADKNRLPICSYNSKGYFWPADKNDLQICIADLESRIATMTKHIDVLKAFLFE